jgi:hypothetical protein
MLAPIIVAILVYCLAINKWLVTLSSVRRVNLILRVYGSIIVSNSVTVGGDSTINVR